MMEEFPGRIESRMEWSRYRSYNALFLGDVDLEKANNILWDAGYKGLVFVDNGISKLMETKLKDIREYLTAGNFVILLVIENENTLTDEECEEIRQLLLKNHAN